MRFAELLIRGVYYVSEQVRFIYLPKPAISVLESYPGLRLFKYSGLVEFRTICSNQ